MTVFAYHATDAAGHPETGSISADSARQARDSLRERGLIIDRMVPEHERRAAAPRWSPRRRSQHQVALAVRELATLLAVGIPLADALDTLCRQHSGAFRTTLMLVRDRVNSGAALATAMSDQPEVFDEVAVQMVQVGENAGTLDAVLEQLAEFKERSVLLKDRVWTALLYPVVVLTIAMCVSLFLMTFIVPMLLTNLVDAGRELPWPTVVLKGMSDFLLAHGVTLAVGGGLSFLGLAAFARTESGRRICDRALLKIPLLGTLLRQQAVARMAFVMATLLRSGIVFVHALDFAARTSKNSVLRDALLRSREAIDAGQDIGAALDATNVLPPMVIHVFSVGQESGRLESMLERLAETYDRQVATTSARFTSLLEPILIVVLAVFVGFILFATMLPILEAGNVL